ncbi:MAG TPA: hypothetical protein VHO91_21750 [Rhodopila sp.]|nr:hypothetical protein [Rhodopila sp.]
MNQTCSSCAFGHHALVRAALVAGCLMLPMFAQAQPAGQLVGLFIQGCLPFAGNPPDLRAWAAQHGLAKAPEAIAKAFLHNTPGEVFDGSTPDAKLALVSSDSGLCSVAIDQATQADVTQALEAGLQKAGLRYRLVIERDDKTDPAIHNREYLAAKDNKGWRILEATVSGEAGGRAMLTAGPE